ncbi:MAG: hypothetical protein J3K34DRAFT_460772 [Monoraphidium minutum]|nr:MAG: hypothetical protein J3K34DRAFT_460772 [Monoraphidium minutum]
MLGPPCAGSAGRQAIDWRWLRAVGGYGRAGCDAYAAACGGLRRLPPSAAPRAAVGGRQAADPGQHRGRQRGPSVRRRKGRLVTHGRGRGDLLRLNRVQRAGAKMGQHHRSLLVLLAVCASAAAGGAHPLLRRGAPAGAGSSDAPAAAAAAARGPAPRRSAGAGAAGAPGPARRLLQDTSLGVGFRGTPQGVARQKNTADLGVAALNQALGPQDGVTSLTFTDFLSARSFFPGLFLAQTTFAANPNYAAAAKSTSDSVSRTDREGGSTAVEVDSRSISQPGLGTTSSAAGAGGATLSQTLLEPGVVPEDGDAAPGPVNDVVLASQLALGAPPKTHHTHPYKRKPQSPLPPTPRAHQSRHVVLASQLALGVAGDYSVASPDYDDDDGARDYDYGQVRPIPSTAVVTARTNTDVRDGGASRRGASFGAIQSQATAPAAATRANTIASNFQGQSFSINYNDNIGAETRTDFYNPVRAGGAQAAGISVGRNYKFTQPSSSVTAARAGGAAGTVGGAPGPAGAFADVLGAASGRRSSTSRGQTVSVTSIENIDIDVGR